MLKKIVVLSLSIAVIAVAYSANADNKEEKKFSAVCPVSGKPAVQDATVDYKGGKVYFCCPGCPKAFAAKTDKYAAKANHQLVATGQAKQVKCPLTGKPINAEQKVTVGGVDVSFCCAGCKGKAAKASGDDQVNLVFGDKALAKGFAVKKKK